jgi:hypothetical protein
MYAAAELALPGGVPGDAGDPGPARAIGGELPPDQTAEDLLSRHALHAAAKPQPGQPRPVA